MLGRTLVLFIGTPLQLGLLRTTATGLKWITDQGIRRDQFGRRIRTFTIVGIGIQVASNDKSGASRQSAFFPESSQIHGASGVLIYSAQNRISS